MAANRFPLLCLISYILVLVAGQPTPEVTIVETVPPSDPGEVLVVLDGTSFSIACQVENTEREPFWIFETGDTAFGIDEADFPNKYLINRTDNVWRLTVLRVNQADDGKYQCVVRELGPSVPIMANVTVSVHYAPIIQAGRSSHQMAALEGDDVTLLCTAEGNPTPSISWVKTDGRKAFQGSKIYLNNVTRKDRGLYRCTAENSVPPAAEHHARLYVSFSPSTTAARNSYEQEVNRRLGVLLDCRIDGYPQPTIEWYRQRGDETLELLQNSDKYQIYAAPDVRDSTLSVFWTRLEIRNIQMNDIGKYICKAYNQLGKSESVIMLNGKIVTTTPGITTMETTNSTEPVTISSNITVPPTLPGNFTDAVGAWNSPASSGTVNNIQLKLLLLLLFFSFRH